LSTPVFKKGRKMDQNYFIERYPFKNKPFLHQWAYLQRFWEDKNVAVLAEMGTGKSFMLINNAAMLYDKGRIDAVLIVAPKGVYRNWYKSEIPKHMPDHVKYSMACWNPNPRKAEKEEMDQMLNAVDDLRL
jgi:superfamily II DNA or RNA helicase